MSVDREIADPKAPYADVLEQLRLLSRDMLLAFRLQVGKLMLDRFFGGSAHEYHDVNPHKAISFAAFLRTCPDELADYGLGGRVLRDCINARITFDGLPPQVRDGLLFSHVVELARLGDPTTRARLAMDVTLQHWTVDRLKLAIGQLHLGNYYDTDSTAPGTQPPEPLPEPEPKSHAGRLVSRLVKTVQELDTWRADWAAAKRDRLRHDQRERYKQALAELKAKVAAMEEELG